MLPELVLSEKVGIVGTDIMFSSNDTPAIEFQKARQLNAIINLDDISHIPFLEKNGGIPEIISVRYNPGKLREGSFIMGNPEDAKFGFTREHVFTGLSELRQRGSKKFGIHTFIASNELNPDYFVETAGMLFDLTLFNWDSRDIYILDTKTSQLWKRTDQLDKIKVLGIKPSFFAGHVYYCGDRHTHGAGACSTISP